MKFVELKQHISANNFDCNYLISGDDDYLLSCAVDMFRSIVSNEDMNINVFSDFGNIQAIINACDSFPFLSDKRLVILNHFALKADADSGKLVKYLKSPNPSTVLVVAVEEMDDKVKKLAQYFTEVDCNRLDNKTIEAWIAAECSRKNCSITEDARKLLIEYSNRKLTKINSELEKLSNYKCGGTIAMKDIADNVIPDLDYKIFELSEAIATKNNDKSMLILDKLISDKHAPVALLGLLSAHFRRLLFCSISGNDSSLAKHLGVKEYAVTKALGQAKLFSSLRLKRICEILHAADFDFKSGKISDRMALDLCVLSILNES